MSFFGIVWLMEYIHTEVGEQTEVTLLLKFSQKLWPRSMEDTTSQRDVVPRSVSEIHSVLKVNLQTVSYLVLIKLYVLQLCYLHIIRMYIHLCTYESFSFFVQGTYIRKTPLHLFSLREFGYIPYFFFLSIGNSVIFISMVSLYSIRHVDTYEKIHLR